MLKSHSRALGPDSCVEMVGRNSTVTLGILKSSKMKMYDCCRKILHAWSTIQIWWNLLISYSLQGLERHFEHISISWEPLNFRDSSRFLEPEMYTWIQWLQFHCCTIWFEVFRIRNHHIVVKTLLFSLLLVIIYPLLFTTIIPVSLESFRKRMSRDARHSNGPCWKPPMDYHQ